MNEPSTAEVAMELDGRLVYLRNTLKKAQQDLLDSVYMTGTDSPEPWSMADLLDFADHLSKDQYASFGALLYSDLDVKLQYWYGSQAAKIEQLVPALFKEFTSYQKFQALPAYQEPVYFYDDDSEEEGEDGKDGKEDTAPMHDARWFQYSRYETPQDQEVLESDVYLLVQATTDALTVPARKLDLVEELNNALWSIENNPAAHSYDYLVAEDEGGELQRLERTIYYEFIDQTYNYDAHTPRRHDDLKALLRRLVLQSAWVSNSENQRAVAGGTTTAVSIALTNFRVLHRVLDNLDFVGNADTPEVQAQSFDEMTRLIEGHVSYSNIPNFVNSLLTIELTQSTPAAIRLAHMINLSCVIILTIVSIRCIAGSGRDREPFPRLHYNRSGSFGSTNLREVEEAEQADAQSAEPTQDNDMDVGKLAASLSRLHSILR
jgi:hypothetical protein